MRIRNLGILAAVALSAAACTAKVKDEGRAPEINVNADSARLPDVEVQPANVEVGTDTHTVVTPSVNVSPASPSTTKP
jgi:hypothetical protein